MRVSNWGEFNRVLSENIDNEHKYSFYVKRVQVVEYEFIDNIEPGIYENFIIKDKTVRIDHDTILFTFKKEGTNLVIGFEIWINGEMVSIHPHLESEHRFVSREDISSFINHLDWLYIIDNPNTMNKVLSKLNDIKPSKFNFNEM